MADGCAPTAGGRRAVRSDRTIDARAGSRGATSEDAAHSRGAVSDAARRRPRRHGCLLAREQGYFIETHRRSLPLEFTLLRYDPRPWTVVDSLLCGLQMYRNLTTAWRTEELQKQAMLTSGDQAKVNFLFPIRAGFEFQPGSNAWAISGKHTASGKPILANDPHLEFGIPSTWYQVHLRAPDLDVIGVSLPGVPCVIIGHNERIAWGVTNLGFDVQDLYIERLDPASGRYVFRGQLEQARLEAENIPVKGARPVEFRQWVTRHGPVSALPRIVAIWRCAGPQPNPDRSSCPFSI